MKIVLWLFSTLVLLAENEGSFSLSRLVMSFEKTTQESGLTIIVAKTKQLITLPDPSTY